MHVLITGARAPACLEWARAFAAAGWTVSVADSLKLPLSRFSQAVQHFVQLPPPRSQLTAYTQALQHVIRQQGIDLVIPTCEEAFYLSFIAPQLPCPVLCSPFELMHQLHHKGQFAALTQQWAQHAGAVQAPESILLESNQQAQAWWQQACESADARLDWVLKPAYSRFANRACIRPAVARQIPIQVQAGQPWLAQRFIAGREYCSYSVLQQGRLVAHSCYHPKYRVGQGSGIWFEPQQPQAVRQFVERFGAQTGYHGQVAFDYIEDACGRFFVLECNPRATSGVHLFAQQARELVQVTVQGGDLLLCDTAPAQVALAMWLFAAPKHGWRKQFWRDYRAARDVITRAGDHKPLWAQLPGLAEISLRALRQGCGLLKASTADIEWDGEPL